jgi:hypothetical protein
MNDFYTTIIATLLSAFIAYIISKRTNNRADKESLDNRYNEIVQIAIQYPYLENGIFGDYWSSNKNSTEEEYIRYDNYCKLVFNFIEAYCKYHNFNQSKIEEAFNLQEWVIVHKQWIQDPFIKIEQTKMYSIKFKELMHKYTNTDYNRYPNALF